MLTKTSLLRSYKLPVLANYGAAQTAWRTVAPTPHTATVTRDKTDNKHLRQSKNALEPYNKSTRPQTGDVASFFCHSSVIMVSRLRRFSRRLASKAPTGKTRILFPRSTRQLLNSGLAQFAVTVMPMPLPPLMTLLQAMMHPTK
jgi:hypothetical protein